MKLVLTGWLIVYIAVVDIDYTPFDDSWKNAFIFLSNFMIGCVMLYFIWRW